MDIVVWLRSLGLGQYEAAFRENEIDETILPNMSAEDLKDLGVGIVGHRRKILDAIAALRAEESTKMPSATVAHKTDPLLLFSVLYGFWIANYIAFNGEVMRELAAQFLTLAEKQRATALLMIGHRLMAVSLLCTGDMAHRSLATRFGQDAGVSILSYRGLALFLLGYPEAALVDAAGS